MKEGQKHNIFYWSYQEADLLVGLNEETAYVDFLVTPTSEEWGDNLIQIF